MVTQYRKAFNHNGDYESIEKARAVYCEEVGKQGKLNEKELHILYLRGKIKADEEQLQRHQFILLELQNELEKINNLDVATGDYK